MRQRSLPVKRLPLIDYKYLLKACGDIGTPYDTMVDDDVVAPWPLDGWYHRTRAALTSAEKQTKEVGGTKCEFHPAIDIRGNIL
jgi:hypothetical protein